MSKVFKAIPFDATWIDHDKIDIHAIYRRPVLDHRGRQIYTDGVPQWDYTGGLPVRRHHDWVKKGFEYVTLASRADLTKEVVDLMRARGLNPSDYIMDEVNGSPWDPELYLATAGQVEREKVDALTRMVEQFGSEAVLAIKRADNPAFTLPEHLQHIPPGGKARRPEPASSTTVASPVTEDAKPTTVPLSRNNPITRELKKAARKRVGAPAAAASEEVSGS